MRAVRAHILCRQSGVESGGTARRRPVTSHSAISGTPRDAFAPNTYFLALQAVEASVGSFKGVHVSSHSPSHDSIVFPRQQG